MFSRFELKPFFLGGGGSGKLKSAFRNREAVVRSGLVSFALSHCLHTWIVCMSQAAVACLCIGWKWPRCSGTCGRSLMPRTGLFLPRPRVDDQQTRDGWEWHLVSERKWPVNGIRSAANMSRASSRRWTCFWVMS